MTDPLAYARSEHVSRWWCSGRVVGEADEIEPRTFQVARDEDRFVLLDGDGHLLVVGDANRDLAVEDGELNRYPARQGFKPFLSANLLLKTGSLSPEALTDWQIDEPLPSTRANRPAVDVKLMHPEYVITIGVDDETGLWTWLSGTGLEIEVDRLTVGRVPSELAGHLALLDAIKDVDLSHREALAPELTSFVSLVEDATAGVTAEVLDQDPQTAEIRLVLIDRDGETQALVSRRLAEHAAPERAILSGIQHRWTTNGWSFHVDTASSDPVWSRNLVRALQT